MAGVGGSGKAQVVVLDAGALLALARGDDRTRAVVARSLRRGYTIATPTPVVAQLHRGGPRRAATDRVMKTVDAFLATTVEVGRSAGELLGRTGMTDAVDAIVAAEALARAPALILTTDRGDLSTLVDAGAGNARVLVVGI